jgi:hypothetical protein
MMSGGFPASNLEGRMPETGRFRPTVPTICLPLTGRWPTAKRRVESSGSVSSS